MIWKLTREQLRSQKRFVAWTAALLTLAIALATYAAITNTTQISNDLHAQRISGYDRLFSGYANSLVLDDDAADGSGAPAPDSVETLDAQIQAAIDAGSDIQVSRDTWLYATTQHVDTMFSSMIVAIGGEYDWTDVLAEGSAPRAGEIVVSRKIADHLGVKIGDTIDTQYEPFEGGPFNLTGDSGVRLTVSGISKTPSTGRNYDVGLPEAIAAWEDGLALAVAGYAPIHESIGQTTIFTTASWNTATTDLSAFTQQDFGNYGSSAGRSTSSGVSIAISVALFIGLIVMSFAVGRSQAQARTSWAATARIMGARRSTIAAATIIETLVIGLAASAVGILIGWLAVAGDLALIRSSTPDAFLPSTPVVVWWVLGIVLLLGLAISAIIGAVPAFWASRVSPVAALKPVSPVTEAEVSRRVNARYLVYPWAICVAGLWFAGTTDRPDFIFDVLGILLAIAVVVMSFALAIVVLRPVMPSLGRKLGRSSQPWAIAAGDAIASRPRQSAIPAVNVAMVAFGGVVTATLAYLDESFDRFPVDADFADGMVGQTWGIVPSIWLSAYVVAITIAVLIGLAIFGSGARESQADHATRTALGMTHADARRARGAHFGLPLVLGLGLGATAGFVTGFVLSLARLTDSAGPGGWWPLSGVPSTLIPNLVVVATTLAVIALGTVIVAIATSRRTPVQDLARVAA